MTPRLAPIDLGVVGLYVAALFVLGLRRNRTGDATDRDFVVAGRTLTLPAFVATLVATWYGGILGVGEMAWSTGVGTWTVFGLPYYVFALVYAFALAGRVRAGAELTIPERIEHAHGRAPALVAAGLLFCMVTPAPYALMAGTLFQGLFGGPLAVAVAVGTLLSVVFVLRGGFETDVRTNLAQFVLMFAGFAAIVAFALPRVGGLTGLARSLPPSHTALSGGLPPATIAVWYLIALWTLADPGFHQRCAAARDPKTARRGILLSVICWAVFDFLTVTAGCCARVLAPDLARPIDAYPALADAVLPPGLKGLFWTAMLATVMSTLLSYTLLAGIAAGRDLVGRIAPHADPVRATRMGIAAAALLAVGAALALPSVIGLWYVFGTAFVPGLLPPLLSAYSPARWRPRAPWSLVGLLIGTALPLAWMAAGWRAGGLDTAHYPLGIEPMVVGLTGSALAWGIGVARRPVQ